MFTASLYFSDIYFTVMKRPSLLLLTGGMILFLNIAHAQVNLPAINSSYAQSFDSLAAAGTTNEFTTLPYGWSVIETGSNANTTYAASTGSANAGNTYSFGTTAERALGGLQSGSLVPIIGAGFNNTTGSTITSLHITYTGEQWRLGTLSRPDRLDFQYSLNATSVNTGTWTDMDALDFISPVTTGTVGLLNGNDTLNNTTIDFTIAGLSIEPGDTFYIRWLDFNASGADDGLAIDNFSITPIGLPSDQPSISFVPAALNFGDINVGATDTLSYEVIAANLSDSVSVTAFNPAFSVSIDNLNFSTFTKLPQTGGIVYVRFAPTSNGPSSDSIYHFGGNASASLQITGSGFDQAANIIPISLARSKPAGEKVTVAGRITVAFEQGNPAFIQDVTGGIPVFDFTLATGVQIGDSVIVTGPIGIFNDQKQISGSGIFFTKVNTPAHVVEPVLIDLADLAEHEGQLVTVQNVELVNDAFVFYPQSTERIQAGAVQGDLRIDGDTNIPGYDKPDGLVNITGVVGRFRTNAQLLPRFIEDIPGATLPTTPADSVSKEVTLDIVNWNLEFFGAEREDYGNEEYGPANEPLQLDNVKKVIESLHADIIAVQEVSSDSAFHELVNQLGRYKYTCSDRYSYSFEGPSDEFPPQQVCFIYDTLTVSAISARPLFENLYDSARTIDPSLLPGYPSGDASSFYSSGRLPYLFTAEVTIEGITKEISLIDIHAKSGAALADWNRRVYDAAVLKDTLDQKFADRAVVILGDLNDDLDQSITTGQASPYESFVTDTARYAPLTKALSDAGARSTVSFNDVIDHQIISNELAAEYLAGSATVIAPFALIPNYANTTSDHLPVITRYRFIPAEVNFIQAGLALTEDSSEVTIALTLSKSFDTEKTITLQLDGTATAGEDFNTTPAPVVGLIQVTVPIGATTVNFKLTIINDMIDEVTETIQFSIVPGEGLSAGSQSHCLVTIDDNDVPTIRFTEMLSAAKEGSGEQQIAFTLSGAPATDQTVSIVVTNGPGVQYGYDYTTSPGVINQKIEVTIPAGEAKPSFTITPNPDFKNEWPELISFYIDKTSPGLVAVQPKVSVFSILDVRRIKPSFAIFPNPTAGVIHISYSDIDASEILSAELFNSNGNLKYMGTGTLQQIEADVSSRLQQEQRGLYQLKLTLQGEVFLIRILKI